MGFDRVQRRRDKDLGVRAKGLGFRAHSRIEGSELRGLGLGFGD